MAYISFQPSDFFNAALYTGTGSELAVSGVGFQPDAVWLKVRNTTGHHQLFDAARGVTKVIYPSQSDPEGTVAQSLKTFDSDGFTLGTDSYINTNANTYISYNWKAGTTTGLSGGTITPSAYSFNTTSCFSAIAYTGNYTSGATVPHGLGAVPKMIFVKNLSTGVDWAVYSSVLGATKYLNLNTTAAPGTASTRWNDTEPTSTVFTIGNTDLVNTSGDDYIAYCFANVKGYSRFGDYTGTGSSTITPFIYTGFRPAWILIKRIDGTIADWIMIDNKRIGFNESNYGFVPNNTSAETTGPWADILSNGFKIRTTSTNVNNSGTDYIYAAFAESPIVSSNDVPTVAR